jgi:hypothetical protein
MKPDSDEYYCFQWCGRMRWTCVRNMTGRDCKWVLACSLGRIVPGRVESWGGISTLLNYESIYDCCILDLNNLTFSRLHMGVNKRPEYVR